MRFFPLGRSSTTKIPDLIKHSAVSTPRDQGDAARDVGDWRLAAEKYCQHLNTMPSDFAIWVQLGHARKEIGDFSGAAEAYERATNLRPDDADLCLNFGRLLRMQGKSKEAVVRLRKSIEIDGNHHAMNEVNEITGGLSADIYDILSEIDLSDQMRLVIMSGFFDPAWYLRQYTDLDPNYSLPLQHFVEHGGFEWRSPGPHFDTEWYLLQNPDLVAGVEGRVFNPLVHFIKFGAREGRRPVPPSATVLITAQSLVDDIYDIEPYFYTSDRFIRVKSLLVVDALPCSRAFETFKRVFNLLDKPYDFIITVPWLIHGGAELMALNMARAAIAVHGNGSVLVLAIDYPKKDAAGWLPSGVKFLMLQDGECLLSPSETMDCLFFLVQAMRPKCVINVNSMACWEMIRQHGRALSQITRLYGCAFCRDYNAQNFPGGYADTHARETLPWLAGLISDNSLFFATLSEQFQFPPSLASRFITLYNPTPYHPKHANISPVIDFSTSNSNFKVIWASRFTRQKNITLLKEIVKSAPDIMFDVWGRGDAEASLRECAASCDNLTIKGPYALFNNILTSEYSAFLYTSLWDGIPNVLLEASGADLPIVSSNVGGISELVDADTGWLIEDLQRPDQYVAALREIRDAPHIAVERTKAMQERLKRQHSWEAFIRSMQLSGILERGE